VSDADGQRLLLRPQDKLRFVPDAMNGETGWVTFRAWDQTGTIGTPGGTSPFSTATAVSTITVSDVNDAPVLSGANNFTPINEDQTTNSGDTVATLTAGHITDVDTGAVQGIAVTGFTSINGKWQYSIDAGNTWIDVGPVSDNSSLLLRSIDKLRFLPDGNNGSIDASHDTITFRAWDRTTGTYGTKIDTSVNGGITAFSTATAVSTITVSDVNDAPVLSGANNFTPITEDQTTNSGDTVATLTAAHITDVDNGALIGGIAVTATTAVNGKWQYSLDAGNTWSDVGFVSDSSSLLLRPTDKLRYLPDGNNGSTDTIVFRAWDQTQPLVYGTAGMKVDTNTNGGSTPFSTNTAISTIVVGDVNDAPVLHPEGNPTLPTITEDNTNNAGSTVGAMIDGVLPVDMITDVDIGALEGIAVTGVTATHGKWQYSLDGGSTWNDMAPVSDTSALLLRRTDKLRFQPDAINGSIDTITFRAWDQTTGTPGTKVDPGPGGGTSAFSIVSETATINVISVNDAPAGTDHTVTMLEDGTYTFAVSDFGFTDPSDSPPNAFIAVEITTLPAPGSLKLDGVAVTAGQFVTVADITAGKLKYTPPADANGSPFASFTFQVQDDGGTANGGVNLDQSPNTVTINVISVNNAPAGTDKTVTMLEDGTYTFSAADFGFTDPHDNPPNVFIAVEITTIPASGSLKLGGVAVVAGQFVSVADINANKLTFAPAPNANGSPYTNFTFQVEDDGGTANLGVNLDQSPNTMTINVTSVNDAPVPFDDFTRTAENTTPLTFAAEVLKGNDSPGPADETWQTLTVIGVSATGDTHGTVSLSGGNVTYTPFTDFVGTATFEYVVQDNGGTDNFGVDHATGIVHVTVYSTDTISPTVTNVLVRGTAWTPSFPSYNGYSIPVGSGSQLLSLPWTNINQIKVVFSENIVVDITDLTLSGINIPLYDTVDGTFSYNPTTFTATWTLPDSTYIGADKIVLRLNADGADPIRDFAGNRLDGEWTNPPSTIPAPSIYPSGNGTAGGDFLFRFNVLPGDVNQNGYVQASDGLLVRGALGSSVGQSGYTIFKDLNGNGYIQSNDGLLARGRLGNSLPGGEPTANSFPSNTMLTAAALPTATTDQGSEGSSLYTLTTSQETAATQSISSRQSTIAADTLLTAAVLPAAATDLGSGSSSLYTSTSQEKATTQSFSLGQSTTASSSISQKAVNLQLFPLQTSLPTSKANTTKSVTDFALLSITQQLDDSNVEESLLSPSAEKQQLSWTPQLIDSAFFQTQNWVDDNQIL
jgi:hypothetical protein